MEKVIPKILTPFRVEPLQRLVSVMKSALKHNFLSSMLLMSGGIMAMHYNQITDIFGGCPVVVATGEPETGKSTSMKATMAVFGK